MRPIRKKIILDLREAIIKGEYPPGTRLVENDLCARFKASRTPVREALAQMEKEGFVCITPGSGTHVTELSIEDIAHIYDILIVLEGTASRLACNQISEEQLGKLEEYNFHFEKSLKNHNVDLLFELNDRFHWLITSETSNSYLMDMRSNFRALVNRITRIFLYVPGQMETTIAEHRQIIAALRARNPALAEFVMREHLENAKKLLLAYLCDKQAENLAGNRGVKGAVS
jgi:DNA-binding GntR family transcriptional regulator